MNHIWRSSLLRSRIKSAPFLKNVLLVGSGAAIGQALLTLFSPLLTRLYTPEAFGTFGSFAAIIGPLTTIVCLRYDSAVVLEDDPRECAKVVLAAGLTTVLMVLLFVSAVSIFDVQITARWGQGTANMLLYLGGPSLLVGGGAAICSGLCTRANQFRILGRCQTARSTGTLSSQAILAALHLSGVGLVIGQLCGQLIGAAVLFSGAAREALGPWRSIKGKEIWRKAVEHHDFALYSAPQSLINQLTASLPVLLLASLYGAAQAGFFWLAYRMLMLPSLVIAESVRGVFYRRTVTLQKEGKDLTHEMRRTCLYLGAMVVPVVIVLLAAGPTIFELAFGERWAIAGEYARIISVPWMLTVISVPAAVLVRVVRLQRELLIYEIVSVILRTFALVMAARGGTDLLALTCYSAVGVAVSACWLLFIYRRLPQASTRRFHEGMNQ